MMHVDVIAIWMCDLHGENICIYIYGKYSLAFKELGFSSATVLLYK